MLKLVGILPLQKIKKGVVKSNETNKQYINAFESLVVLYIYVNVSSNFYKPFLSEVSITRIRIGVR